MPNLDYSFNSYNIETNVISDVTQIPQGKYIFAIQFLSVPESLKAGEIFKHIPTKILIDLQTNDNCLLIIHDAHESWHWEACIEDLYSLALNENINPNNILILTPNPVYKTGMIKVIVQNRWEIFVRHATEMEKLNFQIKDLGNSDSARKFVCLNRFVKAHRLRFIYEMYSRDLLNDFRITCSDTLFTDLESSELLIDKCNQQVLDYLKKSLPWIWDGRQDFERFDNYHLSGFLKIQQEGLIFVITETNFIYSDLMHLTEKTFKAIQMKMPFIIVGQPGSLKRLQELGYRTFDHIWNESYDQEMDHNRRMELVCDLIEDLNKKSFDELKMLIHENSDILEHNFRNLMERRSESEMINFLIETRFVLT